MEINVGERNWDEIIEALRYEYTTSLKDACKLLKASRNWVNQYVRPHVKCIYLNNNIRAEKSTGANWVRMASIELEKPMTESIWFHTDDLYDYIKSSICSVTKQTKSVPVSYFMTSKNLVNYIAELNEIDELIRNTKNIYMRASLYQKRQHCYYNYISDDPFTEKLFNNLMNVGKRTAAPHTTVPLPDVPISEWIAPHDIKDYGDTDEMIYRDFFRKGYIRVEIKMADTDGAIGRKVYYLPDPNPIVGNHLAVIFSEEAWQEYISNHHLQLAYINMQEMLDE